MQEKIRTNLNLTPILYAKLKEESEKTGISMSEIIRNILANHFKQQEK
jgi:hypothetical protein